jgi:MFS transporter, UMF1 family
MSAASQGYPPRRAVVSWIFFDWAAQPFFTLVTTFVFAPYFVSAVASDAARGQALWGYATGAAGLLIALTSPMLGAVADAAGPKKPWIAAFGAFLVVGCIGLWFSAPGAAHAVAIGLGAYMLAAIGAEFATVFNNSMMPRLVPPERLGRLSGTGWATGYAGGLVALAVTLLFLAADPRTGRTLIGVLPAFGLDAAAREGDRFVGPLSAIWFIVFVTPMFLLTPDAPATRKPLAEAARDGLASLTTTLRQARRHGTVVRFLLANMIYQDGLVALFAFGGIYGAGVFGWQSIQLGIFGILLTIAGTFGAVVGGRLDDRIGGKPVVLGSLVVFLFCCLGIVSLAPDRVLFFFPVAPGARGGIFSTLPEQIYLGFGLLIGLVAGPMQAASRSLLVRLAPPDNVGQFFGLFALSGKATSFVAPLLVALATDLSGRQDAAVVVLIVFFTAGALALTGVDVKRPAVQSTATPLVR